MSNQHPERSSWAVQNSLFLISRNSVRNLRKAILDVVLLGFFCSDLMLKTSLVCKSSLFKINNLLFSYIKFYNVKTGVQLDTIPVQDCWNPADKHQSPALLCVRRTAHEFSGKKNSSFCLTWRLFLEHSPHLLNCLQPPPVEKQTSHLFLSSPSKLPHFHSLIGLSLQNLFGLLRLTALCSHRVTPLMFISAKKSHLRPCCLSSAHVAH